MKTTRHTRATELLSIGVNPAKAARQLGHDKETFLKTYADYMPDYDEGSDDLLESAFGAVDSAVKVPQTTFCSFNKDKLLIYKIYMERETRFELATPTLARSCSTN